MTSSTSTPPEPATARPAFEAHASLAQRLNLRLIAFILIVLIPLAGLGWIYFKTAFGSGVVELDDGYTWVDLQKMSSFAFDQRNGTEQEVPEQFRALDGRKVVLEGEMYTTNSSAPELREFDLVWSVTECCFSGPPQVQHFVRSKVADGTVPYYSRPVRVRGTLSVNVTRQQGQVTGVYHLDVESVEPAT